MKKDPEAVPFRSSEHWPVIWKAAVLLAVVGVTIYANSLFCGFQFDDGYTIVENPKMQHLSDLSAIWSFDPSRFLTNLTFALNYHFSGLRVAGYHAVNILIHLVNSWFVFLLAWLTLQTPLCRPSTNAKDANGIAILSGLLFLCHPIQTQAVTYIVQRSAALATLFYLGTLLSYILSRRTRDRRWYGLACLLCFLSMFTKQTAFTLPLTIILYDRVFLNERPESKFQLFLRSLPFGITLLIVPALTLLAGAAHPAAGFAPGVVGSVTPWHYFLTQLHVILTYLRLLVVPIHQSLAYDVPVVTRFWELKTLLCFALLVAIFGFGIAMFKKQRLIAFGIFWFFLTMSVESSFIPIMDVIFEHRLYLPMVGIALAVTGSAYAWAGRKRSFKPLAVAILVALSALTVMRNQAWATKLTLWQDSVRNAPRSGAARYSLGLALAEAGRTKEALREYQLALDLGYKEGRVYNSFARIYEASGQIDQAIRYYEMGVAADPGFAPAFNNLAALWAGQKKYEQALDVAQKSVELDPLRVEALGTLGAIYASLGRFDEASTVLKLALQLNPDFMPARQNLKKIHQRIASIQRPVAAAVPILPAQDAQKA